jgi:hypothetical protein
MTIIKSNYQIPFHEHPSKYIKEDVNRVFISLEEKAKLLDLIKSPQGIKGDKGDKGDTGDAGIQGIQGSNGADGLTTSVNGVQQVAGNITLTKSNFGLENITNHAQWHSGNHPNTISGYGITDIPTTLPASDVFSWAKQANKPTYNNIEVGAAPSSTVSFPGFGTSGGLACVGNDARLSDSRQASDVSAWAKSATKPSYTASEVSALSNDRQITINGDTRNLSTSPSFTIVGGGGGGVTRSQVLALAIRL